MKLSVLVPVYNRRAALARCLAALARQTLPRDEFEVVVGDDGSDDAPETLAAEFGGALDLRFAREPHRNRAAALNAAFHASRGDVIVFTDSDMLPTATLLERHRDFHRRDPRPHAALLGHMDWPPSLSPTPFMRYIVGPSAWQFGYARLLDGAAVEWGYFYGGNSSVKRGFLAASGAHDDTFSRAEDIELGYRLAHAGMELFYDASAVNHHDHFIGVAEFARRNHAVGRALVHFVHRHPELVAQLPVFGGAALARDTEAHDLTVEGVVAHVEARERHGDAAALPELYELALCFALGQGVREALRADFDTTPVPATVIVPTRSAPEPLAPQQYDALAALEQAGWEFLLFAAPERCPERELGKETLLACHAAAARARGRQLCFVHRDDLDPQRLVSLVQRSALEGATGLVVDRLASGRDAVAIARPLFFECGGFVESGRDAAFGWRLAARARALGHAPHESAAPVAAAP